MHTLKYAPEHVFQYIAGKGFQCLPVKMYVAHPPGTAPTTVIKNDHWVLELRTEKGSSWQGFLRAPVINSELRMVIDIYGRECDEVLRALPDCHTV